MRTSSIRCGTTSRVLPALRQAGLALVSVLWLLIVLGVIASGVLSLTIQYSEIVATAESRVHLRFAADAAIHNAIHSLLTAPANRRQSVNVNGLTLGEISVDVRVVSEAGRINVNLASPALLSATFAANGAGEGEALSIAAAIADWRDADNLRSFRGAEGSDYRSAGFRYLPRNAAFESVGEIANVKGVNDVLFACVAPLLTVYSASGDVDLGVAGIEVRRVFDWAKDKAWQDQNWASHDDERRSIVNPYSSSYGTGVLSLVATAEDARGIRLGVLATVRLTRNRQRPFDVLRWREYFARPMSQRQCNAESPS